MDYGALELTARKTKIKPLSKQSKFEGSDRQVRGWILKQLVKNSPLLISRVEEEFPQKEVKKIIDGMKEEGMIVAKGGKIVLE